MVVFQMRDWNLSLNYMMLVPAVYVAFHLMKKYRDFTLWAEMLGFMLLSFCIMLELKIGYFSALYIISGAQLSLLLREVAQEKVENQQKFIWVTRKIPILTFVLGLTLGRSFSPDVAWMGIGILSVAVPIQRLLLTGWAKWPMISHFCFILLTAGLYYNFLLLQDQQSIHIGTALVIGYWMFRTYHLSREFKGKKA